MTMQNKIRDVFLDRCLYYYDFDLITGIVESDIIDKFGNNYTEQLGLVSPCTFDELMERSYDNDFFDVWHVADGGVNLLSQASLLKAYNSGRNMVEACIYLPKNDKYYRLEYYIVKDDYSGNPHVFVNCLDTTDEEKSREKLFADKNSELVNTYEQLIAQQKSKDELYSVLGSIAKVYYSMHLIDLLNDTATEYSSRNMVKVLFNINGVASKMMYEIMSQATIEEHREAAIAFTDLSTIRDRMQNKKMIANQFIGRITGWFLVRFITVESDKDGKPTKIVCVTRIIDEEKKQEEKLIQESKTDELTGLFNRRVYEDDIYEHNDIPENDDFVYISIDVNGLKATNDTIGHPAGDELLVGTCECMSKVLGPYGKLYRIGGDEFVAIIFTGEDEIQKLLSDFNSAIADWSGKLIENISISYGYASKKEFPTASVRELASAAEKRMYEAKSAYYRRQGVDRRGQQDAHKALCELYTKILSINLTDDSYKIINMDVNEQTDEKGFSKNISEWLHAFGKSGQVHPDDLDEYLRLTDLNYMRTYFKNKNKLLHIFYRRKYDDGFKKVIM